MGWRVNDTLDTVIDKERILDAVAFEKRSEWNKNKLLNI